MSKDTHTWDLDPEQFGGTDFPDWHEVSNPDWDHGKEVVLQTAVREMNTPIVTPEEEEAIKKFFQGHPNLKQGTLSSRFEDGSESYHEDEPWIQTYSGRRFNPTNPVVGAIVIQDIAHSLSMQCRFSGHVKKFYSVAQHSVLVSYICDEADAFWGLLHDASEAYLVDIPRPLKYSGKLEGYLEYEAKMQIAICQRFGLPEVEPQSVKRADKKLLSTEALQLMGPLHADWKNPTEPLPFKIEPLPPQEAKNLFMRRFFELTGSLDAYEHYLSIENKT